MCWFSGFKVKVRHVITNFKLSAIVPAICTSENSSEPKLALTRYDSEMIY